MDFALRQSFIHHAMHHAIHNYSTKKPVGFNVYTIFLALEISSFRFINHLLNSANYSAFQQDFNSMRMRFRAGQYLLYYSFS